MKVLVIDTFDERRKSMTAKMRDLGWVVTSMCMISIDNLTSILTGHDALVILDQDESVIKSTMDVIAKNTIKCIYNQRATTLLPQYRNPWTYFISKDHLHDCEDVVLSKLESWHQQANYIAPIAQDKRSIAMFETARKIAPTDATVLIRGETGTGKEVLAKFIHQHSHYAKGPFISVNCAAMPENMMEAILFGHEKGAFTSAINAYVGKFEQAQHGTLLLDEISEIPIGLQAKLLRVLQEREVERLGGKKTIKLQSRIIAATNRDLKQHVANGLFRSDLYYRLNVLPVVCLSLAERSDDILALANHFLKCYSNSLRVETPSLTVDAEHKLNDYAWPGNIRELENVIQRSLIMREGNDITASDISFDELEIMEVVANDQDATITNIDSFRTKLEENEAKVILDVLNESDGYRHIAAKKLNISPRTLRYKLAKLRAIGLKVPK